jgi:hypothetical protein
LEREIQSTKESIATYEQSACFTYCIKDSRLIEYIEIAQTKDGSSLARQVNLQKEELERDRQRNEILQKKRDELLLLLQQKRNDIHNKQMSAIRRKQSVKIDLETCKKVTQLEISPTGGKIVSVS